ncbi:MAG: threonylcarbamoyl-AMP synthase, partial [Duncaniella sp.]|nr:threonylcarbamoyl-AMP synthase [Duncaniella sp.]
MKTLRIYPTSINDRYLDEVVDCLRDGGVIIYPTDTLYAIGCDALNNSAIERLCKIKGVNPQKQVLSVVCDGISMASEYARIDNEAFRILRTNLPGPFTFILPAATSLPKVFKGRKEVGIRVPDNTISRAIAERLGHPI